MRKYLTPLMELRGDVLYIGDVNKTLEQAPIASMLIQAVFKAADEPTGSNVTTCKAEESHIDYGLITTNHGLKARRRVQVPSLDSDHDRVIYMFEGHEPKPRVRMNQAEPLREEREIHELEVQQA